MAMVKEFEALSKVGLTNEERAGCCLRSLAEKHSCDECQINTAKAQLKKVVEWGNEPCLDYAHRNSLTLSPYSVDSDKHKKRNCPECWQVLEEEVKDEA